MRQFALSHLPLHDTLSDDRRSPTPSIPSLQPIPTEAIMARKAPFERPWADCPLVVAYGLGVDSTAMLIEFTHQGIRPDLILFADTGGEKPETYAYLAVIQEYPRYCRLPSRRHCTLPSHSCRLPHPGRAMPSHPNAAISGLWRQELFLEVQTLAPGQVHPGQVPASRNALEGPADCTCDRLRRRRATANVRSFAKGH